MQSMSMATTDDKSTLRATRLAAGATVLLFGLFFLHVLLRVNPALIYYHQRPVFLTGLGFLKGLLAKPGGPAEYVALFCSQLNYYPWVGALVITLTAGLICLATRGLLRAVANREPHPAAYFIPAILLMLVYSRYEHDQAASVQILAALAFANAYGRISFGKSILRLLVFLVISAATYYLAGGGYALFAVLCGVLELLKRRSLALGIFCLICAAAVPYGFAAYSYEVAVSQAYAPLLPFSKTATPTLAPPLSLQGGLHLALVVFFPLAAIWVALRRQPGSAGSGAPGLLARLLARQRTDASATGRPSPRPVPQSAWTVRMCVLLIIALAVTSTSSVNKHAKTLLTLRYAAMNRMWEQVLDQAALLPAEAYDMYVMRDVNTALYNTGRLPYEMFAYPQRRDRDSVFLAFAIPPGRPQPLDTLSEMYFELGFMNDAEHHAHAALEEHAQSPETLRRLAKINILKGLPIAARTFIGALGKNPLYRKWARRRIRELDADPLMSDDEQLSRARERMVRADYATGMSGEDKRIGPPMLRTLEERLSAGTHDKLAFEHVMAHYMWARQLEKVVANLHRLTEMGYTGVPRHYQDAALLYAAKHPEKTAELRGLKIGPEARDGIRRFLQVSSRHGHDKQTLRDALMASHDKSYFLYFAAGFSDSRWAGIVRKPSTVTGATK